MLLPEVIYVESNKSIYYEENALFVDLACEQCRVWKFVRRTY